MNFHYNKEKLEKNYEEAIKNKALKELIIHIGLTKEEAMTVADVKAFLDNALTEEIEYTLSYLDETEVLDTDSVSNNLVITLTSDSYGYENTIKYTFSLLGDTNNDGILDMQDVESWLSDNYGVEDATDLSLDMDNDGEVSLEDFSYLS